MRKYEGRGKKCPKCGYIGRMAILSTEERGRQIKSGMKTGIGRQRKSDYLRIYQLRDKGLSLRQIAKTVSVSQGSVQYALRIRRQGTLLKGRQND